MKTVSVRLPDELHAQLTALARQRDTSLTDVVREALESFLTNGSQKNVSAYDLASDLLGSVEGPCDLSTNKKYLEGFGQ